MLDQYNNLKKQLIKNEFKHLNSAQLKAALTSKGALLILAGAGSGKTTTVISRIAYLLKYGNAYENSISLPAGVDENFITYMQSYADSGVAPDEYITDIIKVSPVAPYNILAFTFTNKAANEMKERVASIIGDSVSDMWIGTFHSVCMKILRRNIDKLGGYTSNFVIYDTADQITLIKMCLSRLGFSEKVLPPKEVLGYIGRAKDSLIEPDEFELTADSAKTSDIAKIYKIYQSYLRENNAVDFDDIINLTIKLFKKFDDVRAFYADKFHHVLVDEYQDTNRAQYELISLLSSKHKNLCVVGDDDQSIYGWRGADIRNIIDFENTFPNCTVIRLEQNYRSTKNILDAANSIIKNNENRKGKTLWTSSGDGEKIYCYEASDDRDEADKIISSISSITSTQGAFFRDFAVLYRTHSQSRIIEDALVRNGIPYKIIGGLRFYERKEIKDVLAYLKLIVNPLDNVSLKRIINFPKRGIGLTTISNLEEISAREEKCMLDILSNPDYPELSKARTKLAEFYSLISDLSEFAINHSTADIVRELIERTQLLDEYEKEGEVDAKTRTDNIEELISMAVELEETEDIISPADFLEYTSLITDTDVSDDSADQITLMTVHAAKGLEYPYVFIVGLEEGLFPKTDPFSTDSTKLEEERRLCYVAVTRAKKQLFISHARRRLSCGRFMQNDPSRFISELPSELIDFERRFNTLYEQNFVSNDRQSVPSKIVRKFVPPAFAENTFSDSKEYSIGLNVFHKKFGKGTIASVDSSSKMTILTVDFENFGRKNIISTAIEVI